VRTHSWISARHAVLIVSLAFLAGAGILTAPSPGLAQGESAAPAQPQPLQPKVDLPEGAGKAIVLKNCQDCHTLKILPKTHKSAADWKDVVLTMIDNGADVPPDKIDTLFQYLAKNFGPQSAPATPDAQTPPAATPAPAADAMPPAPEQAKTVELPAGDGNAIATQNCQSCHALTSLTTAHMNLKDWKDTVQTMIDRGADIPADKIDTLVQYLAKNFGPHPVVPPTPTTAAAPMPTNGAPSSATPAQ